jgi:hypothetical protein
MLGENGMILRVALHLMLSSLVVFAASAQGPGGNAWPPVASPDATKNPSVPPIGGGSPGSLSAAASTDLGSVPQSNVYISGVQTISSFGSSAPAGTTKVVVFTDNATLTHNAISLSLPGGRDLRVAPGDSIIAVALGGGNWRIVNYAPAQGSLVLQSGLQSGLGSTGAFFPDTGGVINRMNDRLFVGKDTMINDGTASGTDWLTSATWPYSTGGQITALGGLIGVVGASRTSGNPNPPAYSNIGIAGICYNDLSVPQGCYGGYFEAIRKTGNSSPFTHGAEIDVIEFNSTGSGNAITPYAWPSAGLTTALWLASGGGHNGIFPASLGLGISATPTPFRTGLAFLANSIAGDDGAAGTGEAIAMAKGHEIDWYEPATHKVAATIRSDATNATGPVSIVFGANLMTLNGIVAALTAQAAPETPGPGTFYLYMDKADNKLKAKGPSGTVTILGNP